MRPKTTLCTALAIALLSFSVHADITNNLSLWLKLNDATGSTAMDNSGNGNNAAVINPPGDDSNWTVSGRLDGAAHLNFGVTNQYLSIPDAPNLNFSNNLAFTLSAWVMSQSATGQISGACIIAKGTGGGGEQYAVDVNANKFRAYVRTAASGNASTAITATVGPTNTWQHVTVVYDASLPLFRIYINGQANVSTVTPPTTLRTSAHAVTIGSREGSAITGYNLVFNNLNLDDVHIYSRALSSNDVFQLYASGGNAPIITTQPRGASINVGDNIPFSVAADTVNSINPISYQWQFNGTNIAGATTTGLVLTNVSLASAGTYTVVLTNLPGITVSTGAMLQVQSLPIGDYITGLVGLWTMDEAAGSTSAADASGQGNPAALTGFADYNACWVPGLVAGGLNFNGDSSAANIAAVPSVGGATPASLDFSTSGTFTLAAWVKGSTTQNNSAGVIVKGTGNGGEQFDLDVNAGVYRLVTRNAAAKAFNVVSTVGPNNLWQHIVVVCDTVNGVLRIYVNNKLVGWGIAPTSLIPSTHEITFGNRQSGTTVYNLPFTGVIDDVHIYNRAFNAADVQALYYSQGVGPSFVTPPAGASIYVGDNYRFIPLVNGSVPLTYKWQKNGASISGATDSTLALTNVQSGDAGSYLVVITNTYGAITSAPVNLTVSAFTLTNALAGYWTFDDATGSTVADSSTYANTANLNNLSGDNREWVTGIFGGGFNFNSGFISQFADVPDSAALNFTNSLTFTLSAWVKCATSQITGAGIIAKGSGGGDEQYALDVSGNVYRFYVRNSSGAVTALLSPIAPSGNWQHVVGTFDGIFGVMSLYVDGKLALTTNAPTTLHATTHDVTIGARESSATSGYNFYLKGIVDDVRIYSRALPAAVVQTLYYQGGAPNANVSSVSAGGGITISWPASSGAHLQAVGQLGDTWTNVLTAPVISGDGLTQSVTEAVSGGQKFYRLQNP